MDHPIDRLRGKFIVFDGPDGSGKSTQIRRLREHLESQGLTVTVTFDPGGTPIGDQIRALLLGDHLNDMDKSCEALLFMASRAQLLHQVIRPALAAGHVVICDRFVSATCAYQGARDLDIASIIELGRFAVGDNWPDLTIILDVPLDTTLARMGKRTQPDSVTVVEKDAMEQRSRQFHSRVRKIFTELDAYYPNQVVVVDGDADEDTVHQRLLEILTRVDL